MKLSILIALAGAGLAAQAAHGQVVIDPNHNFSWAENCGWMNWTGNPASVQVGTTYLVGMVWSENAGWINLGNPTDSIAHANTSDQDYGVNIAPSGTLSGYAWGENCGWLNFSGGALASPPNPARLDRTAARFRGYAWGENIGWVNLDDAISFVGIAPGCGSADFNCDGDVGTDADIEAFFACLAGSCPPAPCMSSADFNGDGDTGTDSDIEAFFRVLAGGGC